MPRFVRPFTRRVVNPITRLFAGHLPGFAILIHRGRTSGRIYRTPINVFHDGDERIFALTYGADVQWVRNVLAAGGCQLEERGVTVKLVDPRLSHDPSVSRIPVPTRWFLRLIRVSEFMSLHLA